MSLNEYTYIKTLVAFSGIINIASYLYLGFKVIVCTPSLKRFDCNCYLFQYIAIYNEKRQINDNVRASKIKELNNVKTLKDGQSFLFHEGKVHLYPSVYFHFLTTEFR